MSMHIKKHGFMKNILTFLLIMISLLFFACESPVQPEKIENDKGEKVDRVLDEMPEFAGGTEALTAFVQEELNYPDEARAQQATGMVYVEFVIDEEGKVRNARVQRSTIAFGCEEEAVRVVSMMPDWQPAMKDGQPVKMEMTLPIKFEL